MNIALPMFPVVNKEVAEKANVSSSPLKASYKDSRSEEQELELKEEKCFIGGDCLTIYDPRSAWNPTQYNLIIEKTITIENPNCFFGIDGVISDDSVLGFAIIILSAESNQRTAKSVGQFCFTDSGPLEFNCRCELPGSTFREKIQVQVVLYLKTPGKKVSKVFANISGTLLGVFDEKTLILEGNSSVFPILVEDGSFNDPLWRVRFGNGLNPSEDKFIEEHVAIIFNRHHRSFDTLGIEKHKVKDASLLLDVMSSALQVIIEKFKKDFEDFIMGKVDFESGSILMAIEYFKTKLELDITSPEKLAFSIRKVMEGRYNK